MNGTGVTKIGSKALTATMEGSGEDFGHWTPDDLRNGNQQTQISVVNVDRKTIILNH